MSEVPALVFVKYLPGIVRFSGTLNYPGIVSLLFLLAGKVLLKRKSSLQHHLAVHKIVRIPVTTLVK